MQQKKAFLYEQLLNSSFLLSPARGKSSTYGKFWCSILERPLDFFMKYQGSEKDGSRRSAYDLFKILLLQVFQEGNLFRFLSSDKGETACSKNSYYWFLEVCHAIWGRFVMLLAARVISCFVLVKTKKNRIPVKLVFVRNRNKRNEYIVILSSETDLSDSEIVRLYGNLLLQGLQITAQAGQGIPWNQL